MADYRVNGSNLTGRDDSRRYEYNAVTDRFYDVEQSYDNGSNSKKGKIDWDAEIKRGKKAREEAERKDAERKAEYKYQQHLSRKQEEKEEAIRMARNRFKSRNPFYKLMHRKEKIDNLNTDYMSTEQINGLYRRGK